LYNTGLLDIDLNMGCRTIYMRIGTVTSVSSFP